jgi:hypothetical protein
MIKKIVSVSKGSSFPISKLLVGRRVSFIILYLIRQNTIDVAGDSIELKQRCFL